MTLPLGRRPQRVRSAVSRPAGNKGAVAWSGQNGQRRLPRLDGSEASLPEGRTAASETDRAPGTHVKAPAKVPA